MAIHRLRTTKASKKTNHDNSNNNDSSKTVVWKIVAVLTLGLVILMATDVIELKLSVVQDDDDATTNHELGAGVEQKKPAVEIPAGAADPTAGGEGEGGTGDLVIAPVAASGGADPAPVAAPVEPVPEVSAPVATPSSSNRYTYARRGQPMSDADRQAMISKWGSWTLVDEKKDQRPQHDFYKEYPNRDVPRDKFPSNAWQSDKDYLAKFLPESLALVTRAQEAILAEYGKAEGGTFEERNEMFAVTQLTLEELANPGKELEPSGRRGRQNGIPSTYQGGWTTQFGWDGLKKRMLHAIMTEDNFVFAMGGHSAAAGHGNHFQQSYTLQVQWILEAVFARMGVQHQARNFGNGGLGTLQHGMSAGSAYGPDVDVLMWDSGMTEGDHSAPDAMARQQIMGGIKVPAIWTFRASTAKMLAEEAEADTGFIGTAWSGLPVGTTLEQIQQMPWAMQYVRCEGEIAGICRENEYMGRCWIDRDDYTPEVEQAKEPGGRAGWHPGNRKHQVTGRIVAMIFLQALKDALTEWNGATNYELPDDAWHLTERYDKIRNNVKGLDKEKGWCNAYEESFGLGFMCNHALKSRNQFTPRAYPGVNSITSLMRPEMKAVLSEPKPPAYNPPDLFNPDLHPPPGAIDVLSIVEAGVDFQSVLAPDYTDFYKKPTLAGPPKVTLGKGPYLSAPVGDQFCDGSVNSWCKRGGTNGCLLYAHNDDRNGIVIDQQSGWLVMNIPDMKEGIVVLKFETWHNIRGNPNTEGWTTINNERRRGLRSSLSSSLNNNSTFINATTSATTSTTIEQEESRRELKAPPTEFCDDFRFEFAIDGKVTSWNVEEFTERNKHVQRVVELITIMNDPTYTGGVEKEVEVAVQIRGCPRVETSKVFRLSHIYWA